MSFWAAALPAVVGGIGSYFGAKEAADAQRDANRSSAAMSRESMAFSERMSSTAHQREVEDLRKSGLNPILSAGGGASAPVGAMGVANPVPSVKGSMYSSAREGMRFWQDVKESQARIENTRKDSSLKHMTATAAAADVVLKSEQADLTAAQKRIAQNEAWLSDNAVSVAKGSPRLFGIFDAIGRRGGLLNSAREMFRRRR